MGSVHGQGGPASLDNFLDGGRSIGWEGRAEVLLLDGALDGLLLPDLGASRLGDNVDRDALFLQAGDQGGVGELKR